MGGSTKRRPNPTSFNGMNIYTPKRTHIGEGLLNVTLVRDQRSWVFGVLCTTLHITLLAVSVFLALCGSDAAYNPGPNWDIPPVLIDLLPLLVEVGDSARIIPLGVWPLKDDDMDTLDTLVGKIDLLCEAWTSAKGQGDVNHAHSEEVCDDVEMSDELQGGHEETHERPRGQLPQVSDGFEELTRGNKGWWIEKMRTAFGRSPHRIAGAVRAYIESLPAGLSSEVHKECNAALVSLGDRREETVKNCVVANLRDALSRLARRNTRANVSLTRGIAAAAFGSNLAEDNLVRTACTMLGVHQRVGTLGVVGNSNLREGAHMATAERGRRGLWEGVMLAERRLSTRCLTMATCALIRAFWLHPDNTRVSPCKKDVVLARDPNTGALRTPREFVSKHWLEASQLVIYRRFQAKYPALKIGQRSFEKQGVCKPHNVVRLRRKDNISCCCRYHEDMRMVLEGFDKAREAVHSPCACTSATCCPRVRRTPEHRRKAVGNTGMVCTIAKAGRSTSTFAEGLLCPRVGDKHAMECLRGRCEKCGGLANFKVCDSEVQHEAQVPWSCYETCGTGQMDEDGKEIRRLQFVQKKTKLAALIAKLQALLLGHEPGASPNCQCKGNFLVNSATAGQPEAWAWKKLEGCGDCAFLRPYAYHTFMALHQQRQFQTCVRDLPLGHAVFLFDFSENHSLNIPREVQSLHWVVKQATILVCVVWRHACMAVDGVESTAENPVLVKDYVYLLSDDRKHDHRFIQYMRELIIRDYFIGRGIAKPLFIHEWADGCAGQNKCAAGFADVANSKYEWSLGVPCQRNFFETAHAKGEQDGAGAHVKHAAAVAVISEGDKWYARINCAADLHAFCCERLSRRADSSYAKARASFNQRFFYLVPEDALHEEAGGLHAVDHNADVELRPATGAAAVRIRGMVEEYAAGVSVAVRRGSIMAVKKDPTDASHAYYLVKALSGVTEVGGRIRRDDYRQTFAPGDSVISGRYFEWADPNVRDTYTLDTSKKCLIPCEAVLACDVRLVKRGDVHMLPLREHQRLLALL
ncbi:hypothetical protein CYMTET_18364 [Cymbomonas tetramitiformis]|uniref:Uncharacterized protein n=1 Tax=Cymbomonas tetramitiformis TaxID=36881 RepID=A0AAE0G868_9CHLO|nr:hypothetical protein CYMTET_18364 [Cymbomonas tetramitiformis]